MATARVEVHVNRDGEQTLSVDSDAVTVSSSFDLVIHGHSTPAHVYCQLDDRLADVATVEASNVYVEPGDRTVVPVTLEDVDERLTGAMELTASYGEPTDRIEVTVEPNPSPVVVDERLAEPHVESGRRLDRSTVVTGLVALLVIGLGAVAGSIVGGPIGVIGFVIVLAAVVTAAIVARAP